MDGSTLLSRCARWVGIGRNPLRRRTDRVEAWVTMVLTVTTVACGPLLVWRCGENAYDRAAATAEWQRHRVFPVHAVLLEDTDNFVQAYGDDGQTPPWTVRAEWTAPNGTSREGPVTPSTWAEAGATILIWTDVYGNPTEHSDTDPLGSAIGVGLMIALLMVSVHAGILVGVRRTLNRRRMEAWQREWRNVEPQWSRRR
jgi:hypothetical protein